MMASRNTTVQEPADARRSSAVRQPAAENQTTVTEPSPVDAKTRRPWHAFATPLIGKAVRKAARLAHSGGSAFPGKIAETIDPGFLARTLGQLPLGVVLVSGTNGKTTTTRMVASVLENLGLKVFTNPTGSNFTRGVVSALLDRVTLGGRLDADIAVLELDEAYAVHFVRQIKPRYCLLLNVMRDQLDRFGEIDNTARLLSSVAEATTGTVVLNREDPRIAALADVAPATASVRYFGLDASLRSFFPSDDDMATTVSLPGLGTAAEHMESGQASAAASDGSDAADKAGQSCPDGDSDAGGRTPEALPADVTLMAVGDHQATFRIDGIGLTTPVRLEGVYNLYNAAAALAVVRAVLTDIRRGTIGTPGEESTGAPDTDASAARMALVAQSDTDALLAALSTVTPAFGRGESIDVNGSTVELLLVKNPMGFRLSLASFPPEGHDTMICINDEYADGRDMSWLWDVDFTSLRGTGVAMVSGVRAWDMALRLEYDQVPVAEVDTELDKAVERFVTADPGTPKHIYCTYTAMLAVRARLGRMTEVADAGVGR
ncbi:Mur ligase family protein [Bifidobacterium pullorum]|uniref:Mur ligase family protein n=1 Tax=Bifidobacterium pullorum TaxID=78448 RepID=UPI00243168C3|nr:Mur ligase family protein [Bifidobacterium pullorum]